MAQRVFIKVVGFSDEERHALNTVFRLSEQCRTMYQLWTPQAAEPPRALLLDGHVELVARAGADGAHLGNLAALEDALPSLKPDRIAGVGGLATRHDSMTAGELGADYVLFGEPDGNGQRPSSEAIGSRTPWNQALRCSNCTWPSSCVPRFTSRRSVGSYDGSSSDAENASALRGAGADRSKS